MRPLNFGEILDVGLKIVTRNALTLFKLVAVIVIPLQILSALILASTVPDADSLSGSIFSPTAPGDLTVSDSDVYRSIAGTVVIIIVSFIATSLATGACYKAVADAYLGGRPEWRESFTYGVRRMHSVAWVTFLIGLALIGIGLATIVPLALLGSVGLAPLIILGVLALIPLMAWLYFSWSMAVPALLTEERRGTKALARSFRLVRRRWWPVFGIQLVASLGAGIIASILGIVPEVVLLGSLGESEFASLGLRGLASGLASILTTPFLVSVSVVLYFDLRVRREGFDLQLLAQHIGVPSPGSLPVGVLPPPPPVYQPAPYPPPGYPGYGPPPPGYPGYGPPPPAGYVAPGYSPPYPYIPQPVQPPPPSLAPPDSSPPPGEDPPSTDPASDE